MEATLQQSKIIGNCFSSMPTPIHTVSKDGGDATLHVEVSALHNRWRHTHRNPPRKHFPPDLQGTPRTDNRPIVSSQQRYRRHKSAVPACSGCGGLPHDERRICKAWNRVCYKCQKLNHFANVCKANIQQTNLVENDTHSQSRDKLCDDTYILGLYHTSATHTIPPYICSVQIVIYGTP